MLALRGKLRAAEKKVSDMDDVCRSCSGLAPDEEVRCDSRDCPVMYSRVKANTALGVARAGVRPVIEAFEREVAGRNEGLEW